MLSIEGTDDSGVVCNGTGKVRGVFQHGGVRVGRERESTGEGVPGGNCLDSQLDGKSECMCDVIILCVVCFSLLSLSHNTRCTYGKNAADHHVVEGGKSDGIRLAGGVDEIALP